LEEAAMATLEARRRKIASIAGAALALSGLARLVVGSLEQLAGQWKDFFSISLRIAMDTLPSIPLRAWQISGPYILGHLRVFEDLLQISACGWQVVLTLARLA
jgi:hypothetical protein